MTTLHRFRRLAGFAAALLPAVLIAPSCRRSPAELIEQRREVLGTTFVIRVFAEPSDEVYSAVGKTFDRIDAVARLVGEADPEGDVARLNRAAGQDPVAVAPETLRALLVATEVAAAGGGALDPTWGVLRDAWRFDGVEQFDPEQEAFRAKVARLREKVDYRNVEIDAKAGTVRLTQRGMQIGLEPIAKGLALDEAVAVLEAHGVRDFVVEGGGDLVVRGRRGDRDWTVGIRHPRREAPEVFAMFPMRDRAIATTGDYERFRIIGARRYSHVIDPRTGYPAHACVSATVIHPWAIVAAALATAVFVLGPADGMALVRKYEGAEAVVVDRNLGVHLTPGLVGAVRVRWLKAGAGH